METLGLDLTDDSLAETPHRIAKMYVNEIFSGLDYSTFPKVTVIENKMKVDEMIMVRDISSVLVTLLRMCCESTLLNFTPSFSITLLEPEMDETP